NLLDIPHRASGDPMLQHLINSNALQKKEATEVYQNVINNEISTSASLIEYGICPNNLAIALSEVLQLEMIDLKDENTDNHNPTKISDEYSQEHQVLPTTIHCNKLPVAIREPSQLHLSKSLRMQSGLDIQVVIAQWHQLSNTTQSYLNQRQ